MVMSLGWEPLKERQKSHRLIIMYKVMHGPRWCKFAPWQTCCNHGNGGAGIRGFRWCCFHMLPPSKVLLLGICYYLLLLVCVHVDISVCLGCCVQGTVLGPLLFLVYINDLPEVVSTSTLRLFADDSLLYRQVMNQSDSNNVLLGVGLCQVG
jgi:hypothetical protein